MFQHVLFLCVLLRGNRRRHECCRDAGWGVIVAGSQWAALSEAVTRIDFYRDIADSVVGQRPIRRRSPSRSLPKSALKAQDPGGEIG